MDCAKIKHNTTVLALNTQHIKMTEKSYSESVKKPVKLSSSSSRVCNTFLVSLCVCKCILEHFHIYIYVWCTSPATIIYCGSQSTTFTLVLTETLPHIQAEALHKYMDLYCKWRQDYSALSKVHHFNLSPILKSVIPPQEVFHMSICIIWVFEYYSQSNIIIHGTCVNLKSLWSMVCPLVYLYL